MQGYFVRLDVGTGTRDYVLSVRSDGRLLFRNVGINDSPSGPIMKGRLPLLPSCANGGQDGTNMLRQIRVNVESFNPITQVVVISYSVAPVTSGFTSRMMLENLYDERGIEWSVGLNAANGIDIVCMNGSPSTTVFPIDAPGVNPVLGGSFSASDFGRHLTSMDGGVITMKWAVERVATLTRRDGTVVVDDDLEVSMPWENRSLWSY